MSASTIFTVKELRAYRRWRLQTLNALSNPDPLPNAYEYADFLTWRENKNDITAHLNGFPIGEQKPGLAVARCCERELHPRVSIADLEANRCPICVIEAHMLYEQLLANRLAVLSQVNRYTSNQDYENMRKAWTSAKLDLVYMVCRFEELMANDREWKSQDSVQVVDSMSSVSNALAMYWAMVDGTTSTVKEERRLKQKSVTFIEEASTPGGRAQMYFWRKSPRYEPGRYAFTMEPYENGEKDPTSQDTEASVHEAEICDSEQSSEEEGEETDEEDEEIDNGIDEEIECGDYVVFG